MTLLVFLIGFMIPTIQALDNSSPYSEKLAKQLLVSTQFIEVKF